MINAPQNHRHMTEKNVKKYMYWNSALYGQLCTPSTFPLEWKTNLGCGDPVTVLSNNRHLDTKSKFGIIVQDGLAQEHGWGQNPEIFMIPDFATKLEERCQFRPSLGLLFSLHSIADGFVVTHFSPGYTVRWSFELRNRFHSGSLTRGYLGLSPFGDLTI